MNYVRINGKRIYGSSRISFLFSLFSFLSRTSRAFTLIETMIAISLLAVAIVAPMSLTIQSLASAYYSRDQIVASNLAQEGIESVRALRDSNILIIAQTASPAVNLFTGIPQDQWFTIDTRANATQVFGSSGGSTCSAAPPVSVPFLQTDIASGLYGYNAGWTNTVFKRSLCATFATGTTDEIHLIVIVSWKTGAFQQRSVTITENLYRWVADGSAVGT